MRVLHEAEGQDRQRPGVLRFLILEDNLSEAELIGSRLSEGGVGCELVRVQSRDAFTAALDGMLGGELEIKRRPEAGTTVAAIIPLMRTA